MIPGNLNKMRTEWDSTIRYYLDLFDSVGMNELLGRNLRLEWTGLIHCRKCNRRTSKSFGEGFCYSCYSTAPEAAECIIHPERCRAHLGEGRDPEWELQHHNQPHVVYLAASSAVKVGVTRKEQLPTRWIDQGASSAIILAETPNRYEAGRIEVELKQVFTDKTNWQKMLCNTIDTSIDLQETKWMLEEQLPEDISSFLSADDQVLVFNYPVISYPGSVQSLSFDKTPSVKGELTGIKGQYLIFDNKYVLNIRKHTGYSVHFSF